MYSMVKYLRRLTHQLILGMGGPSLPAMHPPASLGSPCKCEHLSVHLCSAQVPVRSAFWDATSQASALCIKEKSCCLLAPRNNISPPLAHWYHLSPSLPLTSRRHKTSHSRQLNTNPEKTLHNHIQKTPPKHQRTPETFLHSQLPPKASLTPSLGFHSLLLLSTY